MNTIKMKPTEVLNDHIENLIDYLKRNIKNLGMVHGLSDSQISDMERDFIARLAFAAIIGDDEKESEKKLYGKSVTKGLLNAIYGMTAENKSEDLPDYVIKSLSYVNDHCNKSGCQDCIFCDLDGCKLKYTPNEWRI